MEAVPLQMEVGHLGGRRLDAEGVLICVQDSLDSQSTASSCASYEIDNRLVVDQGPTFN